MKINSTVFTVIAISLVAIVSYYIGVSNQIGNPHQPIQTSIEKEHSTSPKTVSKQTETIEAKIDSQRVLEGQPNYTSKLDVQKGKQGEPLLIGRGTDTPSANPVSQRIILTPPPDLPPPPEDALENFDFKYKLYQDRAKAQYEIDMANAGNDKTLQSIAQSNYLLNQSKIASWRRSIESKFHLIQTDENLDSKERELLRTKILDRAGNPIPLNSAEETQEVMNRLDDIERHLR